MEVLEEEDEMEARVKILTRLEQEDAFTFDDFNAVLDRELSVFKEGEKYDYVKDVRDAYR